MSKPNGRKGPWCWSGQIPLYSQRATYLARLFPFTLMRWNSPCRVAGRSPTLPPVPAEPRSLLPVPGLGPSVFISMEGPERQEVEKTCRFRKGLFHVLLFLPPCHNFGDGASPQRIIWECGDSKMDMVEHLAEPGYNPCRPVRRKVRIDLLHGMEGWRYWSRFLSGLEARWPDHGPSHS